MSREQLIKLLDLLPHPEGGFYKETYRSKGKLTQNCLGHEFQGVRNYSTCIYFMLTSGEFSAFHRIKQDEIWHFYEGSPVELHMISKEGIHSKVKIGMDFEKGQRPQFVVPSGYWFASKVADDGDFSLVGCTVSPGFDFIDFEMAEAKDLISRYPQHEKIIRDFTRPAI
jgi:hypothetical protein